MESWKLRLLAFSFLDLYSRRLTLCSINYKNDISQLGLKSCQQIRTYITETLRRELSIYRGFFATWSFEQFDNLIQAPLHVLNLLVF